MNRHVPAATFLRPVDMILNPQTAPERRIDAIHDIVRALLDHRVQHVHVVISRCATKKRLEYSGALMALPTALKVNVSLLE